MNKSKINIMLDLETLGTKPGCKILTLSAVTFMEPDKHRASFDMAIRVDTQDLLRVSQDTVDWWAKQSEEARKAAFENVNALVLTKVLGRFSDWLAELCGLDAEPVIWGKGATFDAPILAHAYEVYGMEVPWNFRSERCYRTLEKEFGHLVVAPKFEGTQHTSLADATYQAIYAERIYAQLLRGVNDF